MTPDFNKEKFKLTITVCDNCQEFNIVILNGNNPSYQEVIGALELTKQRYIFDQTVVNVDEYLKWKREKENDQKETDSNSK